MMQLIRIALPSILLFIVIFVYIYMTHYRYEISVSPSQLIKFIVNSRFLRQYAALEADFRDCRDAQHSSFFLPLLNVAVAGNDDLVIEYSADDVGNVIAVHHFHSIALRNFLYNANWFGMSRGNDSAVWRNDIIKRYIYSCLTNQCTDNGIEILEKQYENFDYSITNNPKTRVITVNRRMEKLLGNHLENANTENAIDISYPSVYDFINDEFTLKTRYTKNNNEINFTYEKDNPCREKQSGTFQIESLEQFNKYYLKDYDSSFDANFDNLQKLFVWKCIGGRDYEQPILTVAKS